MVTFLRLTTRYMNFKRKLVSSALNSRFLAQHSVVDFDEMLNNVRHVEYNLFLRGRVSEIDLSVLKELHSIYRKTVARKYFFRKNGDCNSFELLQFESFDVYLKNLKNVVFVGLLALPNKLHDRTPRAIEASVFLNKINFDSPFSADGHVVVGRKLQVLRYEDKVTYFLEKEAALLELAVIRFFSDVLQGQRNFKPFRNPDTCNSFILQGVVVDELRKHAFCLPDNNHVLVGSASLAPFCALRVDTSTHMKFLPERFFTCGRHYTPDIDLNGLFGVCQRTNINAFVATVTAEQLWSEFDQLLLWIIKIYESFGMDFRVSYLGASKLTPSECCRAAIQLYSRHEQKFIDVARLSVYETFISQRLKILCHNAKRETGLVHIFDGTFLSVPTFVACLLECSTDHLLIPEILQPYMPRPISS